MLHVTTYQSEKPTLDNRSPRQFHDVAENVALLSQDLCLAHGLLAAHARLDVHQVERRVSHVALEAKTIKDRIIWSRSNYIR